MSINIDTDLAYVLYVYVTCVIKSFAEEGTKIICFIMTFPYVYNIIFHPY